MTQPTMITIDCEFPGGNIIVDSIDGDIISIHQDLRDTEGDWFYWCFRVRGAAGRKLTFRFTGSPVIGVRGPAVSLDQGRAWNWFGAESVRDNSSFTFTFARDADDVRFSFGMPYQESHLTGFLDQHHDNPRLRTETLCRKNKGRDVECLHFGNLATPIRRVLLTCRHHCCEMMANYALEGIIETVLSAPADDPW